MDKYEYKLKTEQMLELMEDGAYSRAAELADSIDWRRVRNTTMLMNVSDIYEKSRDYHYGGRSKSRTVRMGESEGTTAGALGSSHP